MKHPVLFLLLRGTTELIQLHNYKRHNFACKCMMLIALSHSTTHNYALPTNLWTTPTVPPRTNTLHAIFTQRRGKQTVPTTWSFFGASVFSLLLDYGDRSRPATNGG